MAQIHSYLIMNAKTELKYVNEEITSEELEKTFNQIAFSIMNEDNIFEDNDEDEINFILEGHKTVEVNLEEIEETDNNELEITNFIDLSASLLNIDNIDFSSQEEEEVSIIHGDPDFDIDEMVNRFVNVDM